MKKCPECQASWDYEEDAYALTSLGYTYIDDEIAIEQLQCNCGQIATNKLIFQDLCDEEDGTGKAISDIGKCVKCGGKLILSDREGISLEDYEPIDDYICVWLVCIDCGKEYSGTYEWDGNDPKPSKNAVKKSTEEPKKDFLEKWSENTMDAWKKIKDSKGEIEADRFLKGMVGSMIPASMIVDGPESIEKLMGIIEGK